MRSLIGLSLSMALVIGIAACGNGGALGSGSSVDTNPGPGGDDDDDDGGIPGDDDDDDGGTGEPWCEIAWLADGSDATKVNVYLVGMPASQWTTGTKTFGVDDVEGLFILDEDEAGTAAGEAYAIDGTFELTVSGTNVGDSVTFSDADVQTYDGATPAIANGGVGDFTGTLADPASEDPSGTGTIAIDYDGTSYTLGAVFAIAGCYADTGEVGEE